MGIDLQWAHALAAVAGAITGALSAVFTFGRKQGELEGNMAKHVKDTVDEAKKHIETRVDRSVMAFDETIKALRQKINDVELQTERRFLPREDFNDFREEYRTDMRDIKNALFIMGKVISEKGTGG